MERVLTSSQRKISPMPTGPKGEKRPPTSSANGVSSHLIEGRFNEVRPERAKTQPPALPSEGNRGRLLPGFWPWPALTLPRIPDRRSLRIGSETTQADVEVAPDVGGRTGIASLLVYDNSAWIIAVPSSGRSTRPRPCAPSSLKEPLRRPSGCDAHRLRKSRAISDRRKPPPLAQTSW